MKVVLRLVGVLALLVVLAAGATVLLLARGGTGLDNWLAQQVVTIANYYLVPTIAFDRFEYDAPGTITLKEATLTAPDGTVVVDATSIVLTLAARPARGRPIEIERITLVEPSVNLVQDASGGFKGLAPFVRNQRVKEQDRAPSDVRLSNVLRIRKLVMANGGLRFEPADGESPMEVTGLTLDLDIEPANEAGEQGSWYAIVAEASRAPLFEFGIQGRVDIDNLVADVRELTLTTTLDENNYGTLPPRIQSLLREHEARGEFALRASGTVPARDFAAIDLAASVRLTDFNVAQGEYRLPIPSAVIEATVRDGIGSLTSADVETLGGMVRVSSATVNLADEFLPLRASWTIEGLDLQQVLRARPSDAPPKIAGILHGEGRIAASGLSPLATMDGWGSVALRKGRLVNLPVITTVLNALQVFDRITGRSDLSDEAEAEFALTPEGVVIERLNITTQVAAVRGAATPVGTITYDGVMDLRVNAGPLEKLTGMLGRVGNIIGSVTDQIASYRIHGPVSSPKVTPRVLGVGG